MENRNLKKSPLNNKNSLRVQFFINGKRIEPVSRKKIVPKKELLMKNLTKEKLERFSKLPKKEPESKVRRLSGRIIYEIPIPGVRDIENVLVNQLENSIEIRAASDTNSYSKTLNINLPIIGYRLDKENLILELEAK
jgi:hypothetical protein